MTTQGDIIAAFQASNTQSKQLFFAGDQNGAYQAYLNAYALFQQIDGNEAFADTLQYTQDIEGIPRTGQAAGDQSNPILADPATAAADYQAGLNLQNTAENLQGTGVDINRDNSTFTGDVQNTITDPTSVFSKTLGYFKNLGMVAVVTGVLVVGGYLYITFGKRAGL